MFKNINDNKVQTNENLYCDPIQYKASKSTLDLTSVLTWQVFIKEKKSLYKLIYNCMQ